MSRLAVLVDGSPLPEGEAVALWDRFSRWMEEHRGDLVIIGALLDLRQFFPHNLKYALKQLFAMCQLQ